MRRPLLTRKAGVRLGESWYCSSACLREGIEAQVRDLQSPEQAMPARRAARLPLGLLLVTRGCITARQWQEAQEFQRFHGGEIGDILLELKFATERQVAEAGAAQWGCPVFTAKPQWAEIQARIPATLLNLIHMAPVHYAPTSNRMLMGFVYGVEYRVLRTIEDMTACQVEPCFITATDCAESIRALSGLHVEVSFGPSIPSAEIAGIVESYAEQIGADEVRLALCQGVLWARLNRDGHPTDLLFGAAPSLDEPVLSEYLAIGN